MGAEMVRRHGQPPRSLPVLALRIVLVLLVLLAIVWAAEWRQRISAASLEHDVAGKLHTSPARCADQTGNGSRWACLVGSGQAARCVVVDVSIIGSWSLERRPAHCRYP
ncbi:MAG TPA: hypothetical protein VJN72_01125 [Gaiellales bacterium]|nr:hypothetical protein [Gaiellales bacterium]